MRIDDANWMQVEEYLGGDDRVVLPVGSTEQHAYLSLGTDSILAERVVGRGGRAARRARAAGDAVRDRARLRRVPGHGVAPARRRSSRCLPRCSTRSTARASAASCVVNGHGGNEPGAGAARGLGRTARRTAPVPQLVGLAGGAAQSPQRSTPASHPCLLVRELPLDPARRRRAAGRREAAGHRPRGAPRARRRALSAAIGDGSYGGPYAVADEDALRVWAGRRLRGAER